MDELPERVIPRLTTPAATQKMAAMNPNKALWEKGDFTRIAASMRESGEALAASLGITPGM